MTGVTKLLRLGPFTPGLNNRRPDFKLARRADGETQQFLRAAVNVDITAEGTVKRRRGFGLALAGSDCHSLWSNGDFGLYVDFATLYRLSGPIEALEKTALRTDMAPGRIMSCVEVAGSVYFSNGVSIGRVDSDGAHEIVPPAPAITPTVTADTTGSLPAGEYTVCFTQSAADGRESPSTVPQPISVAAGGRITFAQLPTSFPAGVASLNIYVTAPNDSTLLRLMRLVAPVASISYGSLQPLGARCATLLLAPMPAGSIVRESGGRLLVASGSTLFYSEPFAYGLTNPARNYIQFPAPITMIESCQSGCFVAADQTYWLAGDLAAASLEVVLPFGAVPYSSGTDEDETAVFWMSSRGLIRGTPDGKAATLQDDNVAVEDGRVGAFLYRRHDGMTQALGALFGTSSTGVAAASFIEAEIIRKDFHL